MNLLSTLGYKEILVTPMMQHKAELTLENQKNSPMNKLQAKNYSPNLTPLCQVIKNNNVKNISFDLDTLPKLI